MKFCNVIEYKKIFLFKNRTENEAGRLVLALFFIFKKTLYEVRAGGQKA